MNAADVFLAGAVLVVVVALAAVALWRLPSPARRWVVPVVLVVVVVAIVVVLLGVDPEPTSDL